MNLDSILCSGIRFGDDEEFLAFRFRLLNALMLVGAFFTSMFITIEWLGINHLGSEQLAATIANCLLTLVLIPVLRGHKYRFEAVATLFITINFLTYVSALVFVVNDELRVLWFYLLIFVVYILLGQRAGLRITALTVLVIALCNYALPVPFSRNALTTLIISLCATSAISWAYTSRAISFFDRLTESNLQLRELANHDPLTGSLNARAFYEIGNRLMTLARRQTTPYSLLFVDIDHFKQINDRYGHESGDRVLQEIAACLTAQIRCSDVLGRIGGEEFSIFLPGTTIDGATALAEKLRAAVEAREVVVHDTSLHVTASIGIAPGTPGDTSIADIQRRADQAMYQAKQAGRNRVAQLAETSITA